MKLVLYIWQLPQHLLGLLLCLALKSKIKETQKYEVSKVYWLSTKARWGVSLGQYIFLANVYTQLTVRHEYGHSIQSKMLGPFYLLAVGIPSVIQNILSRIIGGKYAANYYNRYPENWANRLGGVV